MASVACVAVVIITLVWGAATPAALIIGPNAALGRREKTGTGDAVVTRVYTRLYLDILP